MLRATALTRTPRRGRVANKYGAKRTNGFASKVEASRYDYLRQLVLAGEIADLQTQVRFDLEPQECASIRYTLDFVYRERGGQLVAEDVKGGAIIRDTSIRLKLFAWKFPQYEGRVLRRERGQWVVTRFGERRRRAA